MAIKKVWIEEGCTSCGMCEEICSKVFEMPDEAEVKAGANFEENEDCIKEAAEGCPMGIIKYEE